jgi:uncharacterized protein YecA (UPF0149 family)
MEQQTHPATHTSLSRVLHSLPPVFPFLSCCCAVGGAPKQAPKSSAGKVKPNDPCSCGSAKKFKKCCGDPSKK